MFITIPHAAQRLRPRETRRRLNELEKRLNASDEAWALWREINGKESAEAAPSGDPRVMRIQARKRRIEASGFRVIQGGRS